MRRFKKRRRGEGMNSFFKAALLGIATMLLSEKKESTFSIKCPECECSVELKDGFTKRSGDIEVGNDDYDENRISIRCNKCGNKIVSSDFEY